MGEKKDHTYILGKSPEITKIVAFFFEALLGMKGKTFHQYGTCNHPLLFAFSILCHGLISTPPFYIQRCNSYWQQKQHMSSKE